MSQGYDDVFHPCVADFDGNAQVVDRPAVADRDAVPYSGYIVVRDGKRGLELSGKDDTSLGRDVTGPIKGRDERPCLQRPQLFHKVVGDLKCPGSGDALIGEGAQGLAGGACV